MSGEGNQASQPLQAMPAAPQAFEPFAVAGVNVRERTMAMGTENEVTKYRDIFWWLPFIGVQVLLFALAAGNVKPLGNLGAVSNSVFSFMASALVLGSFMGVVWLYVCKLFARQIVPISLVIWFGGMIVLVIYSLSENLTSQAILFGIYAGLFAIYFYLARNRFPFVGSVMDTTMKAVFDSSCVVFASFSLTLVMAGWTILWFLTIIFYSDSQGKLLTPGGYVLIFTLYWTGDTLRNIAHVTASGAVAVWWFNPGAPDTATASFKRAMTTSFGSVILGSLFVGIIKFVSWILRNSIGQCLRCMLGCLKRLVQTFNVYVFSFVAIYGCSFMEASGGVVKMVKSRGFDMIVNDDLTFRVVGVGELVGGMGAALMGVVWVTADKNLSDSSFETEWRWFFTWVGLWLGSWASKNVLYILRGVIATTFVSWAADPAHLAQTRPEEFNDLQRTAAIAFGNDWQQRQLQKNQSGSN